MDQVLKDAARKLVALAYKEDLSDGRDVTSESLIPETSTGSARIVARETGTVCGLGILPIVIEAFSAKIDIADSISDGDPVTPGSVAVELTGRTIDLLKAERTILNFLGRLSGVATLTSQFVEQVSGTRAGIFDTRKTTPGWRALEKHAVQSGGGRNHRMGLYDAVLIKDNHLAAISGAGHSWVQQVATAFELVRSRHQEMVIQIEVDTLEQLDQVLPLRPDIVLLDNMTLDELSRAVELRGQRPIELEASGGVNLETVGAIAQTGVDRISIGALTHSAVNFDWGLDWNHS